MSYTVMNRFSALSVEGEDQTSSEDDSASKLGNERETRVEASKIECGENQQIAVDSDDDAKSTFSTVSYRPTLHALNRMLERGVSIEEIQETKQSGLISLQIKKNDPQDAQHWIEELQATFAGLEGSVSPWAISTQRIDVALKYDPALTRQIKVFLEGRGFFAMNEITYSKNQLKVVEGSKSAGSKTNIITVIRRDAVSSSYCELSRAQISESLAELDHGQVHDFSSFVNKIQKHLFKKRDRLKDKKTFEAANGIWSIAEIDGKYLIEEQAGCFYGLGNTDEETSGHTICFLGYKENQIIEIGVGKETGVGSSVYTCTTIRLQQSNPAVVERNFSRVQFGSCVLRKIRAASGDIVFEFDFGTASVDKWIARLEKAAPLRRYEEDETSSRTFGETGDAFFARIIGMWNSVVKPAAESLSSPLAGVWSDEDYCKCGSDQPSQSTAATLTPCRVCSTTILSSATCSRCGVTSSACASCGAGKTLFATFHMSHCCLPQSNIGFWIKVYGERNIPEFGIFKLCDFQGDPIDTELLQISALSAIQKGDLFLYLRKFTFKRSAKLLHRMIPIDIQEGNLCLIHPRASPRTLRYNADSTNTTDVVGRLELKADVYCASGEAPDTAGDAATKMECSICRNPLLDTQQLIPTVLLNNHVQLLAFLEKQLQHGINLKRELNLPAIGDDLTPLLYALSQNCSGRIVETLLEYGADPGVEMYGRPGWTCLKWASQLCHPDLRKLLINTEKNVRTSKVFILY